MIPRITHLLSAIATAAPSLLSANGAGKAFELLVMIEVAAELKSIGWIVDLVDSAGVILSGGGVFVQRGGAPSAVSPAVLGNSNATIVRFQRKRGDLEWEMWNGIQFVGRSSARHEFDIAVVPKALGDALRAKSIPTRPIGHPVISIECKHVSADGSMDEMRALIARAYDTTFIRNHPVHTKAGGKFQIYAGDWSQGFGDVAVTFRHENMKTLTALARTSGFSSGVVNLSKYYFIARFPDAGVSKPGLVQLKTQVAKWIVANL